MRLALDIFAIWVVSGVGVFLIGRVMGVTFAAEPSVCPICKCDHCCCPQF